MSADLYEVISLAARYFFALLGVLIVLRAYAWLLSDRNEKHRRLRELPDAGMVGELVVLSGSDLPEGTGISLPREGVLGSVRSCDLFLPASGVRRKHLSFSFQPGLGLLVHPFSGCEVFVNDMRVSCRGKDSEVPMGHGSFLRVGSALLRLRLYAGMDPSAGFEDGNSLPAQQASPVPESPTLPQNPILFSSQEAHYDDEYPPVHPPVPVETILADNPSLNSPTNPNAAKPLQPRRADRWEADWSE